MATRMVSSRLNKRIPPFCVPSSPAHATIMRRGHGADQENADILCLLRGTTSDGLCSHGSQHPTNLEGRRCVLYAMGATRAAAVRRIPAVRNMSDAAASGPERTREDRELFLRHQRSRDPAAREALVHRFLPLPRPPARRYQRAHEPPQDLIQVASLGLIK